EERLDQLAPMLLPAGQKRQNTSPRWEGRRRDNDRPRERDRDRYWDRDIMREPDDRFRYQDRQRDRPRESDRFRDRPGDRDLERARYRYTERKEYHRRSANIAVENGDRREDADVGSGYSSDGSSVSSQSSVPKNIAAIVIPAPSDSAAEPGTLHPNIRQEER